MRDFTLKSYRRLLTAALESGYSIQTFEGFLRHPQEGNVIILRHDVDELAPNALRMAQVERQLGVKASYYFRIVKQSNNPDIIRQIVGMGHEVGYHYEDLVSAEGDAAVAVESFAKNLTYFRQFYPVATVCMHGSSTSQFDNRSMWNHCSLSDFDLLGEPYLSLDFDKLYYLTDTGYAWDGGKYAVRDVVNNSQGLTFHSTDQVVAAMRNHSFPSQSMILAHTLWSGTWSQWVMLHLREWLRNNVKRYSRQHPIVARCYSRLVKAYWKH